MGGHLEGFLVLLKHEMGSSSTGKGRGKTTTTPMTVQLKYSYFKSSKDLLQYKTFFVFTNQTECFHTYNCGACTFMWCCSDNVWLFNFFRWLFVCSVVLLWLVSHPLLGLCSLLQQTYWSFICSLHQFSKKERKKKRERQRGREKEREKEEGVKLSNTNIMITCNCWNSCDLRRQDCLTVR